VPIEQAETPEVVELPDDDAGVEERKAQGPGPVGSAPLHDFLKDLDRAYTIHAGSLSVGIPTRREPSHRRVDGHRGNRTPRSS